MPENAQPISVLLSTQIASRTQRRTALAVSLLMLAACISVFPFAGVAGLPSPAFVLASQVLLALNDLIVAALLLGQYSVQPMRGFAVLAGGYLFTALMSIPWLFSFPGVFAQGGLFFPAIVTPWLYTAWYVALPLAMIVYGLAPARIASRRSGPATIVLTLFIVIGAVPIISATIVQLREWLPVLAVDGHYTAAQRVVCVFLVALAVAALLVLVRRRPYSVLDLWLMVGMQGWMFSMILTAFISSRRFDVPGYVGRLLVVLASTSLLIVLLSEINVLYARFIRATEIERQERERRLREMETFLVHLSRVNDLGQYVSSLIHEMIQPLAAIANYLSISIRLNQISDNAEQKPVLERAVAEVSRATELIGGLREFIKRREPAKQNNDVPEILHRAVRFALGVGAEPPTIKIQCSPDASAAFFDRIQIEQVVFNLVRNSLEAMEGTKQGLIAITTALTRDNMVEISISDTGTGLSPTVRESLFEPFVTSKASGLGIGLSICRVIIEAHGGQLTAHDNPAGGTVFRFTLPLTTAFTKAMV